VVLLDSKILEGRNRALAIHQLGKELTTVNFDELRTTQKPLDHLRNHCLAAGGRLEHIEGSFRIVVARGAAFDRGQLNRQLCDTVNDLAEHESIKEALEHNKWGLSDDQLAGLSSLGKPLLKKVLSCLLYGSGPNDAEAEIHFRESVI
jgi:hypothetical protein